MILILLQMMKLSLRSFLIRSKKILSFSSQSLLKRARRIKSPKKWEVCLFMTHMLSLKDVLRSKSTFRLILSKKYKQIYSLQNKRSKKFQRSYLEKKQEKEILILILIKLSLKIYQNFIIKEISLTHTTLLISQIFRIY